MLTRRLQVLIDEDRYERLQREAANAGAPVGELVRRAIDREYPGATGDRAAAADYLLGLPMAAGPEPDWEDQKTALVDELDRRLHPDR
ncbi:MAG: ribbon-helix-helix protein, CopG family [Thermoleophilaceae bacterium]